jgi:hypothetical protein
MKQPFDFTCPKCGALNADLLFVVRRVEPAICPFCRVEMEKQPATPGQTTVEGQR